MSPRRISSLSIEHALLGFLLEQPLHGYELHQRLQEAQTLGLVWHVKQAHLYALLTKLETEGLIAAQLIPQDIRPPKRLLHLTEAGRAAFTTWRSEPVAHGRDIRIEFLAKLFWAQRHGPAAIHHLIAAQRETTQILLAELRQDMTIDTEAMPFARLVYLFRSGQLEAVLAWLDTCEAALIPVPA